jgi:energy-coupling factor transporter ATP-binding protein EcfA2
MWSSPNPHTITDLVQDDILTAEAAAMLTLFLERRASLIVAAGPSGAGKTTLLTALLDALPPETQRIYLRGCYEPFDFLEATDPKTSTMLVNELSPHLPIYLWGPGVRRALQAVQIGYQLVGTAHATSVDEFIYSLAGYPLRIPAREITEIDLLVLLDAWLDGRSVRRQVRSIVYLALGRDAVGIAPTVIASREERDGPLSVEHEAADILYAHLGGNIDEFRQDLKTRTARITSVVHEAQICYDDTARQP